MIYLTYHYDIPTLEKRESVELMHLCEYSLFIKIPTKGKEYHKRLNGFAIKWFHHMSNEWEVPIFDLKDVLLKFQEIEIIGELPELDEMKQKRDKDLKDYYKSLEPIESWPFPMPYKNGLELKPYGHQIEAFHYMMNRNALLLGDDMGLGKTLEFITGCEWRHKKYADQFDKVLYVTKAGLRTNVRDEINFWVPHRKVFLVEGDGKKRMNILREFYKCKEMAYCVIGYESLRNHVEQIKLIQCDAIALDESHKFKNPKGTLWDAIQQLKDIPFKVVMSGTYIINNHTEAWTQLNFIGVENRPFRRFVNDYYIYGGAFNREILGTKDLDKLGELVRKNMLRRKKSEVLDMPDKIHQNIYVEMGAKQARLYRAVRDQIKQEIMDMRKAKTFGNPLVKLLRLKQVTTNPELIDSDADSIKHETLLEFLEQIVGNGEKALIFTQFEQEVQKLIPVLAKYKPVVVTGATKDRKAAGDILTTDPSRKVLLGTAQACREGLNLTVASYVIFLDLEWAPAYIHQAEDRAHRIGQVKNVNILRFIAKDTIDEYIVNVVLAKKQRIFDEVIEGKMTLSESELNDLLEAI